MGDKEKTTIVGRIYDINVRGCADLSKTGKIVLYANETESPQLAVLMARFDQEKNYKITFEEV